VGFAQRFLGEQGVMPGFDSIFSENINIFSVFHRKEQSSGRLRNMDVTDL
jgi:hypothetical protein